jgi:hypothetical protein
MEKVNHILSSLNKDQALSEVEEKEQYIESGFFIARGLLPKRFLSQVLLDMQVIFANQLSKMGRSPSAIPNHLDSVVLAMMRPDTVERRFIYEFVRHLRSVRVLEFHKAIEGKLKNLGFNMPVSFEIPTVRIDIPGEKKFLTPPHQDVRSIRTAHCVTVWIPLRRVDTERGTIAVAPGSHRDGVITPILVDKHVTIPTERIPECFLAITADAGDVVFMNSLCVHKSIENRSTEIKFNVQMFFNEALAMSVGDEFDSLKGIPDYRDL